MKKSSLYILLGLLLVSCETTVDIPIEKSESKLVVNALFNNEANWKVQVSASKYIYDAGELPLIDDAEVKISDSKNNSVVLYNVGQGFYQAEHVLPVSNGAYTLEVSHPFYNDVSAFNELPGDVDIKKIEWGEEVMIDGWNQRRLNITFLDQPGTDYYRVRLIGTYYSVLYNELTTQDDTTYYTSPIYASSDNLVLGGTGNNSNSRQSFSFDDVLFEGKEFTFDVFLDSYYYDDPYSGLKAITVSLSRLSDDYFMYEQSYKAYMSAGGGDSPFSQPVQVYTNVENGLGIFAGFSTTKDSLMVNN